MIKTLGTLVAVLLLLSSNVAFSDDKNDGNALLSQCNAFVNFPLIPDSLKETPDKDDIINVYRILKDGNKCVGLLVGIMETNRMYEIYMKMLSKKKNISPPFRAFSCFPDAITNGQAAKVVVKYLNEHPEKLHERDVTLIMDAFIEAFPCK